MKWFYDLNVRTKLLIGFILMAVNVAIVSYVGITNIKALDNSDTELFENMAVPLAISGDISTGFERMEVSVRDMISESDPQAIQASIDEINTEKNAIDELTSGFKERIHSDETQTVFNEYLEARKKYEAELDKVIALATQNQDAEASALLSDNGAAGIAAQATQDAIAKLVKLKVTDANAKSDANTIQANGVINTMLIIAVVSMIFAIVLGLLLSVVISRPLRKGLHMLKEIRQGHLSERLQMDHHDEVGQLAIEMDKMADDLQNKMVGTMNLISLGDVSMNLEVADDQDEITPALKRTIETIRNLIAEATLLSQAAVEGKLSTRGNTDAFQGGFKEVVKGVNDTLDAVVGPLNVAADYVERISKGDIPEKITDSYNGDFNTIKNNLNTCIDAVNALVADAGMLEKAGVEGRLNTRADAGKHGGDFAKIVNGVNNTLDAVIGPLNVAADYVERISKGDIPSKITDSYNGDFNTIKNNLNTCIDAVNALVDDADMLAQAGIDGKLETRANISRHQGDFAKIVGGVNATLDAVVAPVQEASATLRELSRGNLNTQMVGDYNGDYTLIKNDMNRTVVFLKRYVDEITSTLEAMGQKNLDQHITDEYLGDFQAIKTALNEITTSLSTTMSEINVSAAQVEMGAQQISDGGQALSQGTTEQASSIQELTASIEEVAQETKKNAKNANEANELAMRVRGNAELGNAQMNKMVDAMVEINESSNNISKIIKVIDDIAFQTNILALNAAVEAARAGQHGKGFAVVAEEVRTLAARSAEAAKETTGLIEGSIGKVAVGTHIANETEESLKEILHEIEKVTDLVSNIATASNDQATAIAQINMGIEQVSEVVQTNSATAEESAAASEELSGQAELLKQMVEAFKLKNQNRQDKPMVNLSKTSIIPEKSISVPHPEPIILFDMEMDKY